MLAATDQQTFATLLEFVVAQHQRSLDAEAGARGRRQLPTVLTFAGGINSADHAKTFPTLAQLLRDQVGPAGDKQLVSASQQGEPDCNARADVRERQGCGYILESGWPAERMLAHGILLCIPAIAVLAH